MKNRIGKMGGVLLLAVAFVVGTTAKANAAFVLAVCDDSACAGGGDYIVTDDGAGDLAPGTPGILAVSNFGVGAPAGGVGGFEFYLNSAQTKPVNGSAAAPSITLGYSVTNSVDEPGPQNIFIYAGDTGFTGQGNVTLRVNSATTGQGTTGLALGGDDNAVDANGLNLVPILISIGPISGVFDLSAVDGPVGAAPYALTAGVQITREGTGTSAGNVFVTVPEPASMALFSMGLFGVGLVVARRRKKHRA